MQATGDTTVSGFREAENSPVREGLQLLVVPHVTGPDNNVLLTVIPVTEDFLFFEEFDGGASGTLKLPQTTTRTVISRMMLASGETGVLAGLRTEKTSKTETRIPFLSDIPLLGWLFKSQTDTVTGSNLMIFVTPTVLDFQRPPDVDKQVRAAREKVAEDIFGTLEDVKR